MTPEQQRYEQLYESAVTRYLDKTDFNPTDWLDEDEAKEFNSLNN